MIKQIENEIMCLMMDLGFNQNETVAILLELDYFQADEKRLELLYKLRNNKITTQKQLGKFSREITKNMKLPKPKKEEIVSISEDSDSKIKVTYLIDGLLVTKTLENKKDSNVNKGTEYSNNE